MKAETTDDYTDAWFIGYTPELVAGIWMGNELGGVPDEPGVRVVVRGPGLPCGRDRESRLPHRGERGAAPDHVLHHVHHQPGVLGVHHFLAARLGLPEDVPLAVLDPGDGDPLAPG